MYTRKKVEFHGGKLYGLENGETTQTILAFMLTSIAGNYKDIVSLSPISHLDSKFIHDMVLKMLPELSEIGFDVIGMSVDNHPVNRRLFVTDFCNGTLCPRVSDPSIPEKPFFLLFDQVKYQHY